MAALLPFPFRLHRSQRSTTMQVLYSANVAEQLGRQRGHQNIYIHPRSVLAIVSERVRQRREPDPNSLDLMIFDSAPPAGWDVVEELKLCAKQPESAHRYDVVNPLGALSGSVYFPEGTFRRTPPETCFLALRWTDNRSAGGVPIDNPTGGPQATR